MKQESLFVGNDLANQPLASRVRPRTLAEFAGQQQLLGKGKVLREIIESDQLPSIIFWGPPVLERRPWRKLLPEKPKPNL